LLLGAGCLEQYVGSIHAHSLIINLVVALFQHMGKKTLAMLLDFGKAYQIMETYFKKSLKILLKEK
jgi:hypothetical protein